MMTSSNGNISALLALCEGIHLPQVPPLPKANDAEPWCFLSPEKSGWANHRHAGDLRCHCAHYDVTVMYFLVGLMSLPRSECSTNPHCTTGVLSTGSCYWEETTKRTWNQAYADCRSKGGILAVASTPQQMSAIDNEFSLRWAGISLRMEALPVHTHTINKHTQRLVPK